MFYEYRPYVRVADRQKLGAREVARKLRGAAAQPVEKISGRAVAQTFWGAAWCDNLESYSDYANRLPRGRAYAKNGSVVHLAVAEGKVTAYVRGSELYEVGVTIGKLAAPRWKAIVGACAGHIDSLVELLQGRLSKGVMQIVTDRKAGMFPSPKEIELECSCPDWAGMCKHIAAALYGVGARLDARPELLFLLRGVDHLELLGAGTSAAPGKANAKNAQKKATIADADLSAVFGIDVELAPPRKSRRK